MVLVVTTLIPALEQLDVVGDRQRVTLGTARRIHHAIGLQCDQGVGVGGRRQTDRVAIGQLAGVLAILLGECTHTPTRSRLGR